MFFKVLLRMMKRADFFLDNVFCFFFLSGAYLITTMHLSVLLRLYFFPLTCTMMVRGIYENKVILWLIITDTVTRTIYHLA